MSHPDALIAVLDANVLYPQWLRDLMLTLAALGYYEPLWSDRIIEEMRRNVLADHPDIDPDRFDAVTINALRRAFPERVDPCRRRPRRAQWTTHPRTATCSPPPSPVTPTRS